MPNKVFDIKANQWISAREAESRRCIYAMRRKGLITSEQVAELIQPLPPKPPQPFNLTKEQLVRMLPNMNPVTQAKVDMELHKRAIAGDNFSPKDEGFLASDMGLKRRVIDAFNGRDKDVKSIISGLRRDIGIHRQYLDSPPDPVTGSHDWHRLWIDIYTKWIDKLGAPKLPPPPPQDFTAEEDEAIIASGGMEALERAREQNIEDTAAFEQEFGVSARVSETSSTYQPDESSYTSNLPSTDDYGNVWDDSSGKWVSPEGNTFDPNEGIWRDDRTGSTYNERTGKWESKESQININADGSLSFGDDESEIRSTRESLAPIDEDEERFKPSPGVSPQREEELTNTELQAQGLLPSYTGPDGKPVFERLPDDEIARIKFQNDQERLAARVLADDAAIVVRFERQAQEVINRDLYPRVVSELETAGFTRADNGGFILPEGATEDDFSRIRDDLAAQAYADLLDPIEALMIGEREAHAAAYEHLAQGRVDYALDPFTPPPGHAERVLNEVTRALGRLATTDVGEATVSGITFVGGVVGDIARAIGAAPIINIPFIKDDPTIADAVNLLIAGISYPSEVVADKLIELERIREAKPYELPQYTKDIITKLLPDSTATEVIGYFEGMGSQPTALGQLGVSEDARRIMYEIFLDPLNLIPGIGFTKADDLRKLGRLGLHTIELGKTAARNIADDATLLMLIGRVCSLIKLLSIVMMC